MNGIHDEVRWWRAEAIPMGMFALQGWIAYIPD
jgi:hypothetical protein